ncbi:MAG: hypothetical protein QW067_08900 [Thermofilaceae archaeon]
MRDAILAADTPRIRLLSAYAYNQTIAWIEKAIRDSEVEVACKDGGCSFSPEINSSEILCYAVKAGTEEIKGLCRVSLEGTGGIYRELDAKLSADTNFVSVLVLVKLREKHLLLYDRYNSGLKELVREEFSSKDRGKKVCLPLKDLENNLNNFLINHLEEGSSSLISLAVKMNMPCEFYESIKPFIACHLKSEDSSQVQGPNLTTRFLSVEGANFGVDRGRLCERLSYCLNIKLSVTCS